MRYKICKRWKSRKGYAPVGRLYSTFWSVLGFLYSNRCTDWGEIWHGGGTARRMDLRWNLARRRDLRSLLRAKFHPNRCNVSPLWGEKPQNRPLSKLNTGALRFSQCCR